MAKRKANPPKFDRCVKQVQKKGGAANAYAVCTAAGTRNKAKRKARKNPAEESAEAYREFHGRPSEEVVTVKKEIHFHGHLAAAGKLKLLVVRAHNGDVVNLSGFKGAILAFNEEGTQLFVEGGDQKVDPRGFGITADHELQDLGRVMIVEYFTTKDHLGKEGGTATYQHEFSKPFPHLVYDVLNEQLIFTGGKYNILPEGIDN